MSDFTFLTLEQAYGPNRLEILNKYDKDCEITDLATILGGKAYEGYSYNCYINWSWWTQTFYNLYATGITKEGESIRRLREYKDYGGRPAISYELIKDKCRNIRVNEFGILVAEYGEYPQQVVEDELKLKLEKAYLDNVIKKTGNKYSFKPYYHLNRNTYNVEYGAHEYEEFEYKGKRYIRICMYDNNSLARTLSNGKYISSYENIWLEVEPIKWLIDEKANIALSEKIVFSGVAFHEMSTLHSFEESDIKKFMDLFFSKEITQRKSRYKKRGDVEEKRPGIKVKSINVDKVQELVIEINKENEIELKRNNEGERPKVKRKTK